MGPAAWSLEGDEIALRTRCRSDARRSIVAEGAVLERAAAAVTEAAVGEAAAAAVAETAVVEAAAAAVAEGAVAEAAAAAVAEGAVEEGHRLEAVGRVRQSLGGAVGALGQVVAGGGR